MVYLNGQIIHVEFKVYEAHSFSFMLEEEMMDVEVQKRGDKFRYNCTRNETVDTPLNLDRRARAAEERKKSRRSNWTFGAAFATFVLVTTAVIGYFTRTTIDPEAGKSTIATIGVTKRGDNYWVTPTFEAKAYNDAMRIEPIGTYQGRTTYYEEGPLTPFGMPLQDGDEYEIYYRLADPGNYIIQYEKPTYGQLQNLLRRTQQQLRNSSYAYSRRESNCRVTAAYRLSGLEGLGKLYHIETSPAQGAAFDSLQYKAFVAREEYRFLLNECLGE